jgi:hypothetical protein
MPRSAAKVCTWARAREEISGKLRALADELQTEGFNRSSFLFWQKVQSTEVGFAQPPQKEKKVSALSRLFFWNR